MAAHLQSAVDRPDSRRRLRWRLAAVQLETSTTPTVGTGHQPARQAPYPLAPPPRVGPYWARQDFLFLRPHFSPPPGRPCFLSSGRLCSSPRPLSPVSPLPCLPRFFRSRLGFLHYFFYLSGCFLVFHFPCLFFIPTPFLPSSVNLTITGSGNPLDNLSSPYARPG